MAPAKDPLLPEVKILLYSKRKVTLTPRGKDTLICGIKIPYVPENKVTLSFAILKVSFVLVDVSKRYFNSGN